MFKNIPKKIKRSLQKFLCLQPREKIGKFNLFLIVSIALIIIFSIGQITTQKIIQIGLTNNLPEFKINIDIFVDGNSTVQKRDGSPLRPFKSIHQALKFIEENPEIKNIYIYPAQYQGALEIPQNINLYAFHPETLITASPSNKKNLSLLGNNIVKGLTIQSGRYAVFIPEIAQSIQIKNCRIENASWYGIYNEKHPEINDQYKLEVIDSEISNNSLQGLYLQKGTFFMKDSKSVNNGEEGVDLHVDINSTILDSEISNNGEGGIETELGNINLTVKNCLIENNSSSGINLQTYSKNSIVKIENNIINNNKDFGIRCAIHAKVYKPYFPKALQPYPAKFNKFSGNSSSIDPNCWRH